MALTVGVDTWVTLIEADDYFDGRPKSEGWTALSDADKEKWLRLSFNWILNDPAYTAEASTVNDNVKNGQCEGALFLIDNYDEYNKRATLIASGVESFTYSKWSETLGELSKPVWVKYFFDGAGYFNGGGASAILLEDSDPFI